MKSLFSAVSGYPTTTSFLVVRPKMGVHRKDQFDLTQFESKVGPIECPPDEDFVLKNPQGLKRFLETTSDYFMEGDRFKERYEADPNFRNWLRGICQKQIGQLKRKDERDVLWARFFAFREKMPTLEQIGMLKDLSGSRIRTLLIPALRRCFGSRFWPNRTFEKLYRLWEGRIQKEPQFSDYGKIVRSIAEKLPADRVAKAQQVLDALDLYLQEDEMTVDEIAIVPGASVTLAKTLERLALRADWNRLTPGEQALLWHHDIQQQEPHELLALVNERAKDWLAFVTQPTVNEEDLQLVLQSARAKLGLRNIEKLQRAVFDTDPIETKP